MSKKINLGILLILALATVGQAEAKPVVANLATEIKADDAIKIAIPVRNPANIEPLTNYEVEGVSFEEINKRVSTIKSKIAEISFAIEAKKKELLVKIESDGTKEEADFMERAEDLTLFKKKYTANMYAKTALARVFEEIKELNTLHANYVKERDAKVSELKSEGFIPDGMKSFSDSIFVLKTELRNLDEGKKNNVKKYLASIDLAKRILASDNALLVKESDLNVVPVLSKK